jgi:uncharacterized protein YjbI with pentapeptide repeats
MKQEQIRPKLNPSSDSNKKKIEPEQILFYFIASIAIIGILVITAALVFGSVVGISSLIPLFQGINWTWTGFVKKTLWDWLQILIIPTILAIGAIWFNRVERNVERKMTLDNQQESALQTYFDRISELLLEKNLSTSKPGDQVQNVARTRILTVLHRLDGNRKRSIIQFLCESNLLTIFDFSEANLSNANLEGLNLKGINLSKANLTNANLNMTNFTDANLSKTQLFSANLTKANLRNANLADAWLKGANLTEADLENVDFRTTNFNELDLLRKAFQTKEVDEKIYEVYYEYYAEEFSKMAKPIRFDRANLSETNFSEIDLRFAIFKGANFSKADLSRGILNGINLKGSVFTETNFMETDLSFTNLSNSNLSHASLRQANLTGANLTGANLTGADFTGANLTGAKLTNADLTGANFTDAILSKIKPKNILLNK